MDLDTLQREVERWKKKWAEDRDPACAEERDYLREAIEKQECPDECESHTRIVGAKGNYEYLYRPELCNCWKRRALSLSRRVGEAAESMVQIRQREVERLRKLVKKLVPFVEQYRHELLGTSTREMDLKESLQHASTIAQASEALRESARLVTHPWAGDED